MLIRPKKLAACAGLALLSVGGTAPAQAQTSVGTFANWTAPKIWFKSGAADPAVNQLVAILKRAPFDGLAAGPQLAAQVEAAVAQAQSGNPQSIANAEQVLSSAWVAYVQQIKRPTTGMIYAYPVLQPQGSRPELILDGCRRALSQRVPRPGFER